jgi:hypothetical protein
MEVSMAGDWLKTDLTTLDKPEVYAIAEALGINRYEVVGHLLAVWRWFDQHSENGDARVTLSLLSSVTEFAGFAEAMVKVGWLMVDGDSIKMPNFDRHGSKSAKNRALARNRMKRLRDANVTLKPSPEKRREENITNTPKPPKLSGNGKWWESEEATLLEAKARGVNTQPGESWYDLRARIRNAPKAA